jgi:hypothetical protein
MVKAGGTHGAQIATLSAEQREQVIEALDKWLDIKIDLVMTTTVPLD